MTILTRSIDLHPSGSYACIFPGQGSQHVGMGYDFYHRYPSARRIMDGANEILGYALTELMFHGPIEELSLTRHAQPALLTASIAMYTVLQEEAILSLEHCHSMAGHSLGEYSALVASGALSFEDGLRLVQCRGDAMQDAVRPGEGGMIALLGASDDQVAAILHEANAMNAICDIANDNAPGQLVLSGTHHALARATHMAQELGVRVIPLTVSGPFHSRLMYPARAVMQQALHQVTFALPLVPTLSNVLAAPAPTCDAMVDALVEQLTGRVRWVESIRWMIDQGVRHFVEIGPGKVLAGLLRRIDRTVDVVSCQTPDDMTAVTRLLNVKEVL